VDRNSGVVKIIINRDVIFNKSISPCKLENLEVDPKPNTPNDFVITGSTPIQVEQLAFNTQEFHKGFSIILFGV